MSPGTAWERLYAEAYKSRELIRLLEFRLASDLTTPIHSEQLADDIRAAELENREIRQRVHVFCHTQ